MSALSSMGALSVALSTAACAPARQSVTPAAGAATSAAVVATDGTASPTPGAPALSAAIPALPSVMPAAHDEPDDNPYPASFGPTPPGHYLLAIDPTQQPFKVVVPQGYVGDANELVARLRICVSQTGSVSRVEILQPSIPAVDLQIPDVIVRWSYRPYIVEGRPAPFCYPLEYRVGESASAEPRAADAPLAGHDVGGAGRADATSATSAAAARQAPRPR